MYMRPCEICNTMTDNPDNICPECMQTLIDSGAIEKFEEE